MCVCISRSTVSDFIKHSSWMNVCPRVHKLCRLTIRSVLRKERNASHLQTKTALREMRRSGGLQETKEMSSILRDKSPALPSTACPWSSHCNWSHTGLSLSATVPETRTHTHWDAKTYRRSCYYKEHNHSKVREAALWAWSETERLKEGFQFHTSISFSGTSLLIL